MALVAIPVAHAGSASRVLASVTPKVTTTTLPSHLQYLNMAYATKSPAERLDLYMPRLSSAGTRPLLIVYVHGGAWESGDKANWFSMDWVDRALLEGDAIASVNYRLSNQAAFPAQIYDVTAAVRWLRANAGTYGYDPNRIVAIGDSAGGNLVGLLAVSNGVPSLNDPTLGNAGVSTAVKAAVLFYAPIDLLKDKAWLSGNPDCRRGYDDPTIPSSPESKYLGAPLLTVPAKAEAADPITYLSRAKSLPKFFIAAGDDDCEVPYQGSVELYNAIVRIAGPSAAELLVLKGSGHYPDAGPGIGAHPFDYNAVGGPLLQFLHKVVGS